MRLFIEIRDQGKSQGFSLVEIVVSLGILGIASMGVLRMMSDISTGLKSQKDIEMRVELFQALQRVKNSVDCATSGPSVGNPAAATLIKRGGGVLLPPDGGNFGRFSLVANMMTPSPGIKILAASFKVAPQAPRSKLAAPEDQYNKKNIGIGNWSWLATEQFISTQFSELATICDTPAAADGSSGGGSPSSLANFSCPSGQFVTSFSSTGMPICATGVSNTTITTTTQSGPSCQGSGTYSPGTYLHTASDSGSKGGSYSGLSCGQGNGNAAKCCSNHAQWFYKSGTSNFPSCHCT